MNHERNSDVLYAAANTARELENSGIEILGVHSNGRRAVLILDRPPAMVGGHLKRRQPNGSGGQDRVMAAEYQGVQLEWTQRPPLLQGVAHG